MKIVHAVHTKKKNKKLTGVIKFSIFFWIAVKFEALATAANVHHILMFGCSADIDTTYRYWVFFARLFIFTTLNFILYWFLLFASVLKAVHVYVG